jgi:hypothetical protein
MRKYLIAGFAIGYLAACAWGQPLPEPKREKLPPPKQEKQRPPLPRAEQPILPVVQPTLPVKGEGRQLILVNDGDCPAKWEVWGTFDKNGILNKVEVVKLQAPRVDPDDRPPGEKGIAPHSPNPPTPNCQCGCTKTGSCTCKDCDHPALTAPKGSKPTAPAADCPTGACAPAATQSVPVQATDEGDGGGRQRRFRGGAIRPRIFGGRRGGCSSGG